MSSLTPAAEAFVTLLVVSSQVGSVLGLVPQNNFRITYQEGVGTSIYTVYYYLPPDVQVGSNLTITLILEVNSLTGLKSYVLDYSLTAVAVLGNGHVLSAAPSVSKSPQKQSLYPGGRWGPVNITIPLSRENTGLSPNQVTTANVTITLLADTWRIFPIAYFGPENGKGSVGSVVIHYGESGLKGVSILPYALVGSGILLLIVRFTVLRSGASGDRQREPSRVQAMAQRGGTRDANIWIFPRLNRGKNPFALPAA